MQTPQNFSTHRYHRSTQILEYYLNTFRITQQKEEALIRANS